MAIYFFDFRAEDLVSLDDKGIELRDVGEARAQAVTALVEAVRGSVIEGAPEQLFAVEVRAEECMARIRMSGLPSVVKIAGMALG